jgi:hypothetical protein
MLAEVVRHHHSPANAAQEHQALAAAVHVADAVAHGIDMPGWETASAPRTDFRAFAMLGGVLVGMNPAEAERCAARLRMEGERIDRLSRSLTPA